MNYKRITDKIKSKNLGKVNFIEKEVGMTLAGFNSALKEQTLKVRDLERISEALHVPMNYWWPDEQPMITEEQPVIYETKRLRKENKKLDEDLERCKRTIDHLQDHISVLKQKLELSERLKSHGNSG